LHLQYLPVDSPSREFSRRAADERRAPGSAFVTQGSFAMRLNLSIGTKLTITVGIGIALVAAMMATQRYSDAGVMRIASLERQEQAALSDLLRAGAALQRMQIGVREIRLAVTDHEADDAHTAVQSSVEKAMNTLKAPQQICAVVGNCDEIEKLIGLAKDYATTTAEITELKKAYGDFSQALTRADKIGTEIDQQIAKANAVADAYSAKLAGEAAGKRATATNIGTAFGAFVIVILIGAACFSVLSIGRPIKRVAAILVELAQDRMVDVPYTKRGDEVGAIARATEVFRSSIAQKVINLRVRSALDVVHSNVMLADDQDTIIYVNAALQDMMTRAEGEVRKVLPDFAAGKLMGAKLDLFDAGAACQPPLMAAVAKARDAKTDAHVAIGSQKFKLAANEVVDQRGARVGTVVEWKNETVEKAIEEEVDAIVRAAVGGDFAQRIPTAGKTEFMLSLANAVNSLCDNTGKALDDLAAMMAALASGDLTKRIDANYRGMFGKLKADANTMAERVGTIIAGIKTSAGEVAEAVSEISASTTDLSQRTEEQASSLQQTSASMDEMSATVKKNAENAQAANQSAGATREIADRSGKVVAQAVEAMAKIEQSSAKISDIIGVIDEIARQTNLLALNAAVEAARAGDAGRGFAVVAAEVRTLAQRSSQAAKDIKELITNSNGQVKSGVDLVNRAGTALTEIVSSIGKVADIVADIATASAEQASGIEQVGKALGQMDEATQQNSALVEENAATAKTLEHQAKAMDQRVSFFKVGEAHAGARVDVPLVPADEEPGEDEPVVDLPVKAARATAAPVAKVPLEAAVDEAAAELPSLPPKEQRRPVARMHTAIATAFKVQEEWKEF
jgi:methyl-accepting chemotaxis protein